LFFQEEDGRRAKLVTGVQTCALPIFLVYIKMYHIYSCILMSVVLGLAIWALVKQHDCCSKNEKFDGDGWYSLNDSRNRQRDREGYSGCNPPACTKDRTEEKCRILATTWSRPCRDSAYQGCLDGISMMMNNCQ